MWVEGGGVKEWWRGGGVKEWWRGGGRAGKVA